jgi:hypothetical protein
MIYKVEEQGQFSLEGQVWQHSRSKLHGPAAYDYRQSGGFWPPFGGKKQGRMGVRYTPIRRVSPDRS